MATAFSENEKELIKRKLINATQTCLGKFGIRKTSVDQLVQMAGISKGAFYSFYPSKEILFFKVFEEYQSSIIEEVLGRLIKIDHIGIQDFTDLIYEIYQKVRHSFIMNIIQNEEFEYLMRKIPEELILGHHSFDDILAKNLFAHMRVKEGIEVSIITASLRAVFMSMLHVKEIGEKEFDKVLKLLITGIAQQLMEEADPNE